MSHVVLARKHRPRRFDQMVGQGHVVQALSHALKTGRLHHAYLFTGTRGIGKTTISRILAKSLNCIGPDGQGGVTDRPCGVCQVCRDIDADRFIDYIELDAASNRGIDEIRELIERASYKPSVGRYKVFMIDEAHQLTKDAFNALLKTLEEPPEHLKFVLATTDPQRMLPTVLSRCLQFNLRPMAPEVVHEHLQSVLVQEGVGADAGALRLLARAARGSMRDALSLTDQAIAYGGGELHEAGVRAMLGEVDGSHAQRLLQALQRRDAPALLDGVEALRREGLSAAATLQAMALWLQRMAVVQAVPNALDEADPDTAAARELAAQWPADEIQLMYSLAVHGGRELALLADEHAALTMVLLRFLAFPPTGAAAGGDAAAPAREPEAARAQPLRVAEGAARLTAPLRPSPSPAPSAAPSAASSATPSAAPSLPTPTPTPAAPRKPAAPALPTATAVAPRLAPKPRADAALAAPPAPAPADRLMPGPVATPAVESQAAPHLPVARPEADLPPWVDEALPDEEPEAGPAVVVRARGGRPAPPDGGAQAPEPAAAAPSRSAAASAPAAFMPTPAGDLWAATVQPLLGRGAWVAMVREMALQAQLLATTPLPEGGRLWRLRVAGETLRAPALQAKLAAALGEALGEPTQLQCEPGEPVDSLALREAHARARRQHEAQAEAAAMPMVQALLARFPGARLQPGSVQPRGE